MLKFFLSLILMYSLFPFYFKLIYSLEQLAVYGGSSIYCFLYFSRISFLKISKKYLSWIKLAVFIYFYLLFISFVLPVIKNTGDFTFFFHYVNQLRYMIVYFAAFIFLKKNGVLKSYEYLLYYIRAVSLYVVFSFILLVPSIRSFWLSVLYIKEDASYNLIQSVLYYTRFGLQGHSGFGHSVATSIGIAMLWFLYARQIECKNNKKRKIHFGLYFLILFAGCFMYARSGFIIALFLSLFAILYFLLSYKKYGYFILLVILSISCLSVLSLLMNSTLLNTNSSLQWALEPIINYQKTGAFSSASSDRLITMYSLPEFTTWLFGDGKYTDKEHYYMETDVGFMRSIYFFGGFNTILQYSILAIILFAIGMKLKHQRSNSLFCLLIVFLFIASEMKGEMFFKIISMLIPFYFYTGRPTKNEPI